MKCPNCLGSEGKHQLGCSINSVDDFRLSIIVWAQNQAAGYRVQASVGKTKHNYDRNTAKAESFEFMVKYLEGMEIRE